MVGSMIQNLFNFKGSKNPENHVEMVKTAFEIASKFRIENIELKRISGKYSRKNGWGPNPKIWYVSSDGGESININPPTTPMGSKYLVAVLYCLCYYFNILQSSELFYNDKKGISQSIATKHGPQKSGYMKELIATLGDENLELELISLADNPLPESFPYRIGYVH